MKEFNVSDTLVKRLEYELLIHSLFYGESQFFTTAFIPFVTHSLEIRYFPHYEGIGRLLRWSVIYEIHAKDNHRLI
jgi:hypothetical protein